MKAVIFSQHGGTEVLRYTDVAEPAIGSNDVLVRVRACALNHLDIWVREGMPGVTIPLPHIGGCDIAGEVAKVGGDVSNVHVGERVMLAPGVGCGHCEQCLSGKDNQCRKYTLLGYIYDGGYAEYVKAPAVNALPMPATLSFEEAAAVPLVFLTAWHMLITRAQLKPSEEVLILGAGSGVGSAAIQIAKLTGARVIATAGSEAKLAKAKELGRRRIDSALEAKHCRRGQAHHQSARRGCGVRARGPSNLGAKLSAAWRLAGGWLPAEPPPDTKAKSIFAIYLRGIFRSSAPTWEARPSCSM